MRKLLTFTLVGVIAQLIDGALGMAYGVTATTLLLSTGASPALASASVHLAEVGTTLSSGISHWRFGNVNWRTVRWIGIPGGVGGFLGATALSSLPADRVKPIVSGLLFLLGCYILARFAFGTLRKPVDESHLRGRFLAPLGVFAGFLDAVGGGGWGPITSPTLMTAGRMEPRKAIGSVSASEFIVALSASGGFLLSLGAQGIDFRLVGALLIGGVVAAPLAAFLVHRLHPRLMGTLVGSIVLITNLRTILLSLDVANAPRASALAALAVVCSLIVLRAWRAVRAERRAVAEAATAEPTSAP